MDLEGTGLSQGAMQRYIREYVYALPGADRPEETFTVLLTGSRATGHHTPQSDVDVDVLCPKAVQGRILAACLDKGLIKTPGTSFFNSGPEGVQLFGGGIGYPHFSLAPLEHIAQAVDRCDDVTMWVYGRARVLTDPNGQFAPIAARTRSYPPQVLHRKLKYHYLLEMYWSIEVSPHHHHRDDELLCAAAALLNAMNEQLRLFYLVEGKPYPYTEALTRHAGETALGRRFLPFIQEVTELVVGRREPELDAWSRLDKAFEVMHSGDESERSNEYFEAIDDAVAAAGVDRAWLTRAFGNINELLLGELGPMP